MKLLTVIKILEQKGYKENSEVKTERHREFQNEKNVLEFSVSKDGEVSCLFQISKEEKERLGKEEQYISVMDYAHVPAKKYFLEAL